MAPPPLAVRLDRAGRRLILDWGPGACFSLPAEYLRVHSPTIGRHAGATPLAGRAEVGIMHVEPVGNYAVRLLFDDLHGTGIYSWTLLRSLGREQVQRWQLYLDALAAHGLSRDPRALRQKGRGSAPIS